MVFFKEAESAISLKAPLILGRHKAKSKEKPK